ncbi:MAG: Sec-independent protein translocase protein TatB [Pseudomonadota bacterium]
MLDIGWQELLVIGALALIVVGPKDLPGLLRTLGQYTGKIRGMAREFQRSLNDAARDSDIGNLKELRDIQRDVRAATNFSFEDQAKRASDSLTNPPKPPKPVDSLAEFEKVKKAPDPADLTEPDPAPEAEAATQTKVAEKAEPAPAPVSETPKA